MKFESNAEFKSQIDKRLEKEPWHVSVINHAKFGIIKLAHCFAYCKMCNPKCSTASKYIKTTGAYERFFFKVTDSEEVFDDAEIIAIQHFDDCN